MFVYYLIFILLAVFSILDYSKYRDEYKLVLAVVSFLVLTIMAGLVGDVSRDYINYLFYYDNVEMDTRHGDWDIVNPYAEIFYLKLGQLFSLLFPFQYYLLFISTISVGLVVYTYYKTSPFVFVSILIYYAHAYIGKEMTQIRAGIASAIVLVSLYRYANTKRTFEAILILLGAFLFHNGAGIALLFFFVYRMSLQEKWYPYLLGLSLLIGFFFPLGAVIKVLSGLHPIFFRIYNYTAWGEYAASLGILTNPFTVKQIIICLLLWFQREKLKNMFPAFSILYFMYVMSTCWLIMFNDFAIFSARVATFLSVGDPILIAMVVYSFKEKKWRDVAYLTTIFFAFALFFINIEIKEILKPYQFFDRFLLDVL